ncbi:MAG TPA: DUF885 family protein [Acidimicrobiales bacterium]|nr:DUF885 family protein [Acidimicrobiales bacterium]
MNPRLTAVCDLTVAAAREYAGLHEYDGRIQDLSPAGVQQNLARLGNGPNESDLHDEAQLRATEDGLRAWFGEVEDHRRNPLHHIENLDLACYDREYAPAEVRQEAKRRHLAQWPEAVDMALEALDQVPAPVAAALANAAKGLGAGLSPGDDDGATARALEAHARLVAHIEQLAEHGDPDPALGAQNLIKLMGRGDAIQVDLGRLSRQADSERDRLRVLLDDAAERLRPGVAVNDLVQELLADHPTTPDEIYAEAQAQIDEATAFTIEHNLLPDPGGVCLVGPAPESRRWAMAMMSWAAPKEPDAPSWYYVTPPDPAWPPEAQEEWLSVFSRTTLPAITVHEVTPGHYAHGRMLRQVTSDVRVLCFSGAFIEGWAHYAEELFVEEGFRADDPRFTIGVCIEALIRVTRLASAIGLHDESMTLEESVHRFEQDAFLKGPAALAEANRASYDPTYGRYTWGKLEIRALRDEARARWGKRYKHRRFHEALLALGAPALGLIGDAIGDD